MGLGFSYLKGGEVKWRIFLGIQLICAIIMLTGSLWVPESPRWLIAQGFDDQALDVLEKLHGDDAKGNISAHAPEEMADEQRVPFFRREFNQIRAQIRLEQETPQLGLISIVKRPTYRKRLYLIVFFFTFQQLTAIIPLQNYQVLLYKSLGIRGKLTLVLVGVWGTTALIVGLGGMYFFDRLGRRKNFFIAMGILLSSSIMLVVFWSRYEASGNTNKTLGSLALWSMFMYLVGYGWILNAFGYTYTPEILVSIACLSRKNDFGIQPWPWLILSEISLWKFEQLAWLLDLVARLPSWLCLFRSLQSPLKP